MNEPRQQWQPVIPGNAFSYSVPMPQVSYPPVIRRFVVAAVLLIMAGVGVMEWEIQREHRAADDLTASRIAERLQEQEITEHRAEMQRMDHLQKIIESAHNPANCAFVRWTSGTLTTLICDPDEGGDQYWFLRGRFQSIDHLRRHRWER